MGWKEENKGSGPWPFAAQPNKWGYLNNPRWMIPPGEPVNYDGHESEEPQVWTPDSGSNISGKVSTPMRTHIPCGHWHKPVPLPPPTTPISDVCIVFIDELKISYYSYTEVVGSYHPPNSLLYYEGFLYAASGTNSTLQKINPVTMVVDTTITYNINDIALFEQIVIYEGVLYAMVLRNGYVGGWIQKISLTDFSLIDPPLYAGSVVYGTDGNVYGSKKSLNTNAYWINQWRPITGSLWAGGWEQLPGAYPYTIYPSINSFAGGVTDGSINVGFRVTDYGYLVCSGPESSTTTASSFTSLISSTGSRVRLFASNLVIGPNGLELSPGGDRAVSIRQTSLAGNVRMRVMDINAGTFIDPLITGLKRNGVSYDGTYNIQAFRWHTNERVYVLHNFYIVTGWRIFALDPNSGTLLYQYDYLTSGSPGSFVILGNYVYVWMRDGAAPSYSYITKLTLDLEFVCREPCLGDFFLGGYREQGRNIVSDGSQYIYNYARTFAPSDTPGLITKWSTL